MDNYQLVFEKRGQDDSAKCNLRAAPQSSSYGAVYRLRRQDKPILDKIEGGYHATPAIVEIAGTEYETFTYLAAPEHIDQRLKPFDWYLELVHRGAVYLGFPESIINQLVSVNHRQDSDTVRAYTQHQLLRQLIEFNQRNKLKPLNSGHLIGEIEAV